jgi:hypothetical protein
MGLETQTQEKTDKKICIMTGTIKMLLRLICVILISGTLTNPYGTEAAADNLPERWQVKSSYYNPGAVKSPPAIVWEFVAQNADSGQVVSVRDANGQVGFRCELFFDRNQCLVRAECYNQMGHREIKLSHSFNPELPAIMEDSLSPCDWLNVTLPSDGESRHFSIKKKAGRSAFFTANIRMTADRMNVHEAVDRGMISTQVKNRLSSKDLMLVRIEKIDKNGAGQEILRQLWSTDLPFWLYEATPFRKSWYMME